MKDCKLRLKISPNMLNTTIEILLLYEKSKLFGFDRKGKISIIKKTGYPEDIMTIIESVGGVQEFMIRTFNKKLKEVRELCSADTSLFNIDNTTVNVKLSSEDIRLLKNSGR